MNRSAVVLAVVSALFLGLAIGLMGGIVFTRHVMEPRHAYLGEPRWRRGPGGAPPRELFEHLAEVLKLSDAQRVAIRAEFEHSRGEMEAARDSLHARVARHLNPEQLQRWRELERDRERHRGFPGDSGGPMPPPRPADSGPEGEGHR